MTDSVVPNPKKVPRKRRGRYSRALRAAYAVLGLGVPSSKKKIKDAYRALAKTHHADVGGSNAAMLEIVKARDTCLAALPKRGRPRLYPNIRGFAIVNELESDVYKAVIHDGFESKKEADAFLVDLRARVQIVVEQREPLPGPTAKAVRLIVVKASSPHAQAQAKHREKSPKPKAPAHWNQKDWNIYLATHGAGVNQGRFIKGAPHGCGLLVLSDDIESIDTARRISQGGPGVTARRSLAQGKAFEIDDRGKVHYVSAGNGPDVFEAADSTADGEDTYYETRLSAPDDWYDEREVWEDPDDPFITGKKVDRLLCDSKEDVLVDERELLDQQVFSGQGDENHDPHELDPPALRIFPGYGDQIPEGVAGALETIAATDDADEELATIPLAELPESERPEVPAPPSTPPELPESTNPPSDFNTGKPKDLLPPKLLKT